MDHIELVSKKFGLKERSVQRIKAEDPLRFESMLFFVLAQKVNLSISNLEEYYERGVKSSDINAALQKVLLKELLDSNDIIKVDIQKEQLINVVNNALGEIEKENSIEELMYAEDNEMLSLKTIKIYQATKYRYKSIFIGEIPLYIPSFDQAIHGIQKAITTTELKKKILSEFGKILVKKAKKDKINGQLIIECDDKWVITKKKIIFNLNNHEIVLIDKTNKPLVTTSLIIDNKILSVDIGNGEDNWDVYRQVINLVKNNDIKEELTKQFEWVKNLFEKAGEEADIVQDQYGIDRYPVDELMYFIDNLVGAISERNFNVLDVMHYWNVYEGLYHKRGQFGFERRLLPQYREKNNAGRNEVEFILTL